VSTRGVAAVKEFTFRGPPAALVPMHNVAGFDVLTLANNHTVDFGRDALLDTLKAVHAAGIQTIGAGANDLQARRPAIVQAGGLRVAFLGYRTSIRTASATARHPARRPTSPRSQPMYAALRRATAVCFFHGGVELHPAERASAAVRRRMLNAGAKLVSGTSARLGGRHAGHARTRRVDARRLRLPVRKRDRTRRSCTSLRRERRARLQLVPVGIDGFRPRLAQQRSKADSRADDGQQGREPRHCWKYRADAELGRVLHGGLHSSASSCLTHTADD
jgi:hypothetical protein